MRKFDKILIGGAFLLGFGANMLLNPAEVYAASGDDITPPKGIISIEGATLRDGVYYTSSLDLTLSIDVDDDVTEKENIKMILSDGPISGEVAVDDSNWEDFKSTKSWTLSNKTDENLLYLYLKDEAENISPNIIADVASTFTVTYAGEGTGLPEPKKAQYGMLFNVAIEEPTLENKYFLGWSSTPGGSVQWLSDGVIEPKYIKGDTTLYAVYADEAPSLADQVTIGDYVDYPVHYENVYTTTSNTYKSPYTGWRVLDVSGDQVTIVTAGTPLLYYHGNNSAASIEALTTNFLTTTYSSNGFEQYYLSLESAFTEGEASQLTENVESMNKDDIDKIVGEVTENKFDLSKYGSLLHNQTIYYLASANTGRAGSLWGIDAQFIYVSNYLNTSHGIRAKVTLVEGVRTSGRNVSGVWKLEVAE